MIEATKRDYLKLLLSLLPAGNIARDEDSNNAKVLGIVASEFSQIDASARGLIDEADPRTCNALFDDWEAFAGLPDACSFGDLTKQERRARMIQKLTAERGQSRSYYEQVASDLGYNITITEYRPFECGISQCIESDGNVLVAITQAVDRFVWSVTVDGARATWFECGESELGVDPFLKLTIADDLECVLSSLKPAHTHVNFVYEEA